MSRSIFLHKNFKATKTRLGNNIHKSCLLLALLFFTITSGSTRSNWSRTRTNLPNQGVQNQWFNATRDHKVGLDLNHHLSNQGLKMTKDNADSCGCGICNNDVLSTDMGIACDICDKWFHAHCQNVTSKEYQQLAEPDPNLSWKCLNCRNKTFEESRCSCGDCSIDVEWSQKAVACEACGQWYHAKCQSIGSLTYEELDNSKLDIPWYCPVCGNPNSRTIYWPLQNDTKDDGPSLSFSLSSVDLESSKTPKKNKWKPQHTSTPTRVSQRDKWMHRPLRILNININSVMDKKCQLLNVIQSIKPDVLILTETKLIDDILSSEFIDDSIYKVYRKDRTRNGGGVLLAIRTLYNPEEVKDLSTECEIIWAKIKSTGNRTLYIGAYYRPDDGDLESLEKLEASLIRATGIKNPYLFIGGDFNLPGWDWGLKKLKEKTNYVAQHHYFADILNDHGLQQLVKDPTRDDKSTLDLMITNQPELVPRLEILPGLSDHDMIYCEFTIQAQTLKQIPAREVLIYSQANWVEMKADMNSLYQQLENIKDRSSTEDIWIKLKDSVLKSMANHIPTKTIKPKNNQPWITPEIRRLIKQRDRAYKRKKKSGNEEDKAKAKELKRTVQREIRRSYWNYLDEIFNEEDNNVANNKKFWCYIKQQKNSKAGISALKKNGRLYTDPKDKAEILNSQFQSVFSEGNTYNHKEFLIKTKMTHDENRPKMDEINITEKGVLDALLRLNANKASGPDQIPPRVLKEIAVELAPSLAILFRSSLKNGLVPSDWKNANVSPIFKKGEHYNPANYRPVSLTCILSKVMEHIISSAMTRFLDAHKILNERQHGFRKGRSCETQLLEFTDELICDIEGGGQVDIQIMDFEKAFDKVNHSLLSHKLHAYGITGKTNLWIQNFLKDRQQSVVIDNHTSMPIPVRSGVPQGSVIGPFLFLVYINDLPDRLQTNCRLFADDTAVYQKIRKATDQETLQSDLKQLEVWENNWDMKFHPKKCNTLPVTRKIQPFTSGYQLHDHQLEVVNAAKYLGVTITNKIDWKEHIANISLKANKTLGFLKRNLKISSPAIKSRAYKAFVRPIVEYAATVWDPYTSDNKETLEKIQKRAARFVLNDYGRESSVTKMLNYLNWETLETRRKWARLTLMYKITNNLVECPRIKEQLQHPKRIRRGHKIQFRQIYSSTDYRLKSFLPRTIPEWNSLPTEVVMADSVDTFVSRLKIRT